MLVPEYSLDSEMLDATTQSIYGEVLERDVQLVWLSTILLR